MHGRQISLEEAGETARALWNLGQPRKLDVPQKPLASIPKPSERPTDWIKYKDAVVFLFKDHDEHKIRLRTGFICSWPGSHLGDDVDNVIKTVVWSDEELRMADDADDAHEEVFEVKDPCLIRLDEVVMLQDPDRATAWFEGVLSSEVARRIAAVLAQPDFGREERLKKEAEIREKLQAGRKPHWWEKVEGG